MARIVKGSGRVIEREIYDARLEAARIVGEATARGDEIRAEAERAVAEARGEGFETGRQQGFASATALMVSLQKREEGLRASSEAELKRLAMRIAEKILGREVAASTETVADIVAAALQSVRTRNALTIRVHPDDIHAVAHRFSDLTVVGDLAVTRGGCVIEAQGTRIDGRLEVQLAAIERALCGDAS